MLKKLYNQWQSKTSGICQRTQELEEDPNKQRWNNLSINENNNYNGSKQICLNRWVCHDVHTHTHVHWPLLGDDRKPLICKLVKQEGKYQTFTCSSHMYTLVEPNM